MKKYYIFFLHNLYISYHVNIFFYFTFIKKRNMILRLPFLGLLPVYYHVVFYRFFRKNVVENGNDGGNMGLSVKYFMVEKNGSNFYYWRWNIKKR